MSIRPAPDTMTYLTALLPVVEGVSVFAALDAAARAANAAGDPRGRGQVMADTLIARATGRDPATPATAPAPVPVVVSLVMTDDTLLGGGPAPASISAAGQCPQPVPAPAARALVAAAAAGDAAWVRRLFLAPETGALVAMESRRRAFPAALAHLIVLRDQSCATPWCDAPIRHTDHITAHTDGGATELGNGQGLCEHCNQIKQTPGWATTGTAGSTTITTPTGHTYPGTSPPHVLGYPAADPADNTDQDTSDSPLEHAVRQRLPGHRIEMHWAA